MTKSHKLTRRRFLGTTLAGSVVIGAGAAAVQGETPQKSAALALDSSQREVLRAAMDEIIPAGDGMPSASQVGGVQYLERVSRQEPQIGAEIRKALANLNALSRAHAQADFTALSSSQRVGMLRALERQSPEIFAFLRDRVYEAYYTQPSVWKLIGYEFHPTNQGGPQMAPFDDSVLAKVRKMPKLYRETG